MRSRIVAIGCVTVLVLSYGFWPGPYRYEHSPVGDVNRLVRINRLTQRTEVFSGTQWLDLNPEPTDESKNMPLSELRKITGDATLDVGGSFIAKLYNGSNWQISEIVYRIEPMVQDSSSKGNPFDALADIYGSRPVKLGDTIAGRSEWRRELRSAVVLAPLSLGTDTVHVGEYAARSAPLWTIVSARGRRP